MPRIFFTGAMAHFPCTTDHALLCEIAQTWHAFDAEHCWCRRVHSAPVPWGYSREALQRRKTNFNRNWADYRDLRLPSTRRIVRVIRKAESVHGISAVDRSTGLY